MNWHKWNKLNDIPFDASAAMGVSCKQTGNGEHKLAHQIGGTVAEKQDFDVLGPDGEKIEVKQLGAFRSTIEPWTFSSNFREKICRVSQQLRDAFNSELISDLKEQGIWELCHRVNDIAEATEKGIGRGSVLGRTFKKKRDPILGLKQILSELRNKADRETNIDALIGNEVVALPLRKFIKIARVAGIDPGIKFSSVDDILSRIDDEFIDSDIFDNLWNSIKPSEILFEKADSVIFVHEELGYYVMDREVIDRLVKFIGTFKGDVQFRVDPILKKGSNGIVERSGEQERDVHSLKQVGHADKVPQTSA